MKLYLTMPKPGETIHEGVIVKWLKKAGDAVEEKEALVELETEKAVFTYESPFKGKIEKILVQENDSAQVGSPLALFEVSEEDGQRYLMLGVGMPVDKSEKSTVGAPLAAPIKGSASRTPTKQSTNYSPLIRSLAKEHGLSNEELDQIPRSDPRGRLSKEDVLNFVQGRGDRPVAPTEEGERISLSAIRNRIAQHMTKSAAQIPKAGSGVEADVTEIWEYCKTHQTKPFHFFLYAVREALKKFPNFNASYITHPFTPSPGGRGPGGGGEMEKAYLIKHKDIHLGFAVATLQGLFTPVVKNAQSKKFSELSKALVDLEKKAKEGKLSVDELTGATFVVNNPGAVGGSRCDQIIPLPTVAIIALNRIQKRPWVIGDEVKIRHIVGIDLAFDHRPLDGADGIQFVEEVKKILEHFPFEVVDQS